ncbi:sensor histidine kinase [Nocardia yamanashiensis]|uniref:ATP-binding protein n=1 Tax=Nocardia yamanashiensis TaxID=209247 RepID=UPI001E490458|nr:sensor histidine kinase [Nocardia yamanashiensis]UGT43939.1 sensor histidine kinase [Nocardia yamanashiensis]
MRRRLLIALTVFATLAVLAFAVPLCLTAATSRTQQLAGDRIGDADRFAALAVTAGALGDNRGLAAEVNRYHDLYGEPVLVVDARGLPIVNAGVDAADPAIAAAVAAARRNQRPATPARLLPWGPSTLLIARPVGSDVHVDGAVLITVSTARARTDIARVWAIVALGALAAMAVFTALALILSRWVLRPLAGLSAAVAGLTASLPKPRTTAAMTRRHGGPPELRAVAESVDTMALAVRDSAAAQRRLVDDTAHAMRNPLAALTIRLDSLEPAIPATAAATFHGATREVERLTALLDDLLTLAVAEGNAVTPARRVEPCDVRAVAADRIDAWHTAFDQAGMTLSLEDTVPAADRRDAQTGSRYELAGQDRHRLADRTGNGHAPADHAGNRQGLADHAGAGQGLAGRAGERHDLAGRTGDGHGSVERAGEGHGLPGSSSEAVSSVPADVLAQILDVALSNSSRYAGPGAHTRITVTPAPSEVTIIVADDGPGVPECELADLTTRFFRGSTAHGIGGSGLGLPIAAALVKSVHGRLAVEPVTPHGLAVVIGLPVGESS